MSELPQIPVITGPTGTGKTALAVRLASSFPLEVVSADSRQIIRHLDIGTAKPTAEERRAVRFHLVDLIEPGERYSAYQFISDADKAISEITERKHIPVVVGGTGLYLRALVEGVIEIEVDNTDVRERLQEELVRGGAEAMHHRLSEVDPEEAKTIHPNNHIRLLRALEIYELTGQPKSKLVATGAYKKSRFEYELYCLLPERVELYDSIDRRVDEMMRNGFLAEVEGLMREDRGIVLRKANVIGYEELLDYLEDRCSLDEAVARIKQNTRRYAKRQITWFRHQLPGTSFDKWELLRKRLKKDLESKWVGLKT